MSTIIQIHTPYLFASLWNFRKLRSDVAVKNSRGESKKTNLLWTTIMFSEKIWSQIKILSLATCLPPPPPPPQLLTKSKPFLKERKGSWACYTKNRCTTSLKTERAINCSTRCEAPVHRTKFPLTRFGCFSLTVWEWTNNGTCSRVYEGKCDKGPTYSILEYAQYGTFCTIPCHISLDNPYTQATSIKFPFMVCLVSFCRTHRQIKYFKGNSLSKSWLCVPVSLTKKCLPKVTRKAPRAAAQWEQLSSKMIWSTQKHTHNNGSTNGLVNKSLTVWNLIEHSKLFHCIILSILWQFICCQ